MIEDRGYQSVVLDEDEARRAIRLVDILRDVDVHVIAFRPSPVEPIASTE